MRKVLLISDAKNGKDISFRQTPSNSGLWLMKEHPDCHLKHNYKFSINNFEEEFDYMVVRGNAIHKDLLCKVPKTNTILVTSEPYSVIAYPLNYCKQFGRVCSCQEQMQGENVIYTPPILNWLVGIQIDNNEEIVKFDYDDYINMERIEKNKLISVVTSDKIFTKGHKDRFYFVRRLKEHFGDRLDVYGHGINDIQDKWDAIAPYKYHIVIENSYSNFYFTEKITDAFIGGAFPFYFGCPNLDSFFPSDSFERIDIHNIEQSINTIEKSIHNNLFSLRNTKVAKSRRLALEEYNMFNIIARILDTIPVASYSESHKIKKYKPYLDIHNLKLGVFDRNICRFKYYLKELCN